MLRRLSPGYHERPSPLPSPRITERHHPCLVHGRPKTCLQCREYWNGWPVHSCVGTSPCRNFHPVAAGSAARRNPRARCRSTCQVQFRNGREVCRHATGRSRPPGPVAQRPNRVNLAFFSGSCNADFTSPFSSLCGAATLAVRLIFRRPSPPSTADRTTAEKTVRPSCPRAESRERPRATAHWNPT